MWGKLSSFHTSKKNAYLMCPSIEFTDKTGEKEKQTINYFFVIKNKTMPCHCCHSKLNQKGKQ